MPAPRPGAAAAAGPDGRIYVLGAGPGGDVDRGVHADMYDPYTDTWTTGTTPEAGFQFNPYGDGPKDAAAATGSDGFIYLGGGDIPGNAPGFGANSRYVSDFDPRTNRWDSGRGGSLGTLSVGRSHLAAATGLDGTIYFLGGQTTVKGTTVEGQTVEGKEVLSSAVDAFNSNDAESSLRALPSMNVPRSRLAAVTGPNGMIYAIGGDETGRAVERYDPNAAVKSWTPVAPMSTPRRGLAAAVGPDGIYAIGGEGVDTVERYDIATNTWTVMEPLVQSRYDHVAVAGRFGRIYTAGGKINGAGAGADLRSVEAYPDVVSPAPPTGLVAVASGSSVQLSWTASTDAGLAGYNVYRSTTANGVYGKINPSLVTTPAYTDSTAAPGTEYFYAVRAEVSGLESANSNIASVSLPAVVAALRAVTDFDGNGTTDKAVYRPSTGVWFVQGGSPEATVYGVNTDIPVPGDFDGNVSTEKAVYRPSTGQWFVRGVNPEITQYGAAGDLSMVLPYAIRRVFFP